MHVALIADAGWLDDELPLFRYLVVGLIDEGERVVQVIPEQLDETDAVSFGQQVRWRDSRVNWLRAHRLARLGRRLDELDVDLVHAMDSRVWAGTVKIAAPLGIPDVLNLNDHRDLASLPRFAVRSGPVACSFVAGSAPLAEAMRDHLPEDVRSTLIAPGVHPGDEPRGGRDELPLCAVITGSGTFDDDYEMLFIALRAVVERYPQALFFLDGASDDTHPIWQATRRFGLLANVSQVPHRLGHRELLLRADVLIQPQALGRVRSLTLQAMARGMPVIGRADAWLDYLVDDVTALLVRDANADAWMDVLTRVIEQRQDAAALGRRARAWVMENRPASNQVASILSLYRELVGESIKFPQG